MSGFYKHVQKRLDMCTCCLFFKRKVFKLESPERGLSYNNFGNICSLMKLFCNYTSLNREAFTDGRTSCKNDLTNPYNYMNDSNTGPLLFYTIVYVIKPEHIYAWYIHVHLSKKQLHYLKWLLKDARLINNMKEIWCRHYIFRLCINNYLYFSE